MTLRLSFLLVSISLAGCAVAPVVREYLDNDTAATITIAKDGWVFARERTDLAVHAQDYITITPVQVNRGGQRTIYLYCQLWSTIDRRDNKAIMPTNSELALIADDRRIALPKSTTDIRRLGFGRAPVKLPSLSAEIRVAPIDGELLRFIISADQLRIALSSDGVSEYFLPWRNGHNGASEFLRHVESVRR